MDTTSSETGETIIFTNTSTNGHSYEWLFGDGTTSSQKSPSKIYKDSGHFTVVLIAGSKNGNKTDIKRQSIGISDLRDKFTGAYKGINCDGEPTEFSISRGTYFKEIQVNFGSFSLTGLVDDKAFVLNTLNFLDPSAGAIDYSGSAFLSGDTLKFDLVYAFEYLNWVPTTCRIIAIKAN